MVSTPLLNFLRERTHSLLLVVGSMTCFIPCAVQDDILGTYYYVVCACGIRDE